MDAYRRERDLDLQPASSRQHSTNVHNVSLPPPTIFPPTLQSDPNSPDTRAFEEPALYKRVIYVHPSAADEQQDNTSSLTKKRSTGVLSRPPPPNCPHYSDYSEPIGSSLWEQQAKEEQEKEEMTIRPDLEQEATTNTKCGYSLTLCSSIPKFTQTLRAYGHEWIDGLATCKVQVLEACCRIACCNVIWGLVMGAWLEQKSRGKWGIVETLLANVLCGSMFALLHGQAILIVGANAPSLIFMVAISDSGHHLGIDVVSWAGWIGIWGSLVLLLLATCGAYKFMTHMTIFSWDVLRIFLGISFLWGAIEQFVQLFTTPAIRLDSALLSLWLASSTFFVASMLQNTRHVFHCNVIADYSPVLLLLLFTAVPHLPKLTELQISQVQLPESGYHTDNIAKLGCIRLRMLPFWAILLAVIPGIMLAGIALIYHSATTAFLQEKAGPTLLDKQSTRWDLCILAFLTILCSLFGLPYSGGLLYQSAVHVRALTLKLHDHSDMENQQGLIVKVAVQRISGLLASLLPAVPLLPPLRRLVQTVPLAVLTGLFLQMALQSLRHWNIITFFTAWLVRKRSKTRTGLSVSALCAYSAAQISCIFLVFTTSMTPAAVLFPVFIFTTFGVRHYAMRSFFKRQAFAKLDAKISKECSEISSSDQLSMASHEPQVMRAQAWPQLTISQTLKSAISAPMADVVTPSCNLIKETVAAETCESPLPRLMSPSLLSASSRRLKERSRRRHKRKRQASFEKVETAASDMAQEQGTETPIPPLVRAMMEDQSPHDGNEEEEINLSKRVSPRLSPQFFKTSKSKPRAGRGGWEREREWEDGCQEKALEVHSNLLYEPKRKLHTRNNQQKGQTIGSDPSTSMGHHHHEDEIEMSQSNSIHDNNRPEIVFQGSPGIGRCIRTSPTLDIKKPISKESPSRRRQLQFSLSLARRRRAPLKEEIYPTHYSNAGLTMLNPRLRKCRTSRWPTTSASTASSSLHVPMQEHQLQRHSTSQPSTDEYHCIALVS